MSILNEVPNEEVLITAVEYLTPCCRSDAQGIVEAMTPTKRTLILKKIEKAIWS